MHEPSEALRRQVGEQLQELFRRSALQREKLRRVEEFLGPTEGRRCLNVVGADEVLSLRLLGRPGQWEAVEAPRAAIPPRFVLGAETARPEGGRLPFEDKRFDAVVAVDVLERVEDDRAFVAECHRVLKPSGRLVLHVPALRRAGFARIIARLLGVDDRWRGRLRSGYSQAMLFDVLKDGFDTEADRSYSRVLAELVDAFAQVAVMVSGVDPAAAPAGAGDEERILHGYRRLVRSFALLYPLAWLAAGLDRLMILSRGHQLVVRARRRQWRPRRTPALRDGRSIADAAINTRIGSASPF